VSASQRIIGLYEENGAAGDRGFAVAVHRVRDPDCGESTIWLASRA
jgi:hypothetical protein